jgi:cell division protein FtsL
MMRNFQRKRIWRDTLQSKPVLIFLGILILVFAWNILGFWNKMQDTRKNNKIIEDKITALEQQQDKLSTGINNLNTDQGKEEVFREKFGLAKEGENEIVIVDDKTPPAAPAPASSSGFWGFLKNLFK